MGIIKKLFAAFFLIFMGISTCYAEPHSATTEFNLVIPEYLKIIPVTSPVLTANITNRTGNLYAPLSTRFRVISNADHKKTLYLQANVTTQGGFESSMFEQGGQVYVAFANLSNVPTSSALANCKMGAMPKDSPGIVAYPVTSVFGANHKFVKGKGKYEVYVENGTTDVTVNIGTSVLRNSYAGNDPKGYYQAILSLTEADI